MILDIHTALDEVQSKSDAELQAETAAKWAARSVACFKLFDETNDWKWILRANSYQDEAIEHAAMVRDGGETVGEIENAINEAL